MVPSGNKSRSVYSGESKFFKNSESLQHLNRDPLLPSLFLAHCCGNSTPDWWDQEARHLPTAPLQLLVGGLASQRGSGVSTSNPAPSSLLLRLNSWWLLLSGTSPLLPTLSQKGRLHLGRGATENTGASVATQWDLRLKTILIDFKKRPTEFCCYTHCCTWFFGIYIRMPVVYILLIIIVLLLSLLLAWKVSQHFLDYYDTFSFLDDF